MPSQMWFTDDLRNILLSLNVASAAAARFSDPTLVVAYHGCDCLAVGSLADGNAAAVPEQRPSHVDTLRVEIGRGSGPDILPRNHRAVVSVGAKTGISLPSGLGADRQPLQRPEFCLCANGLKFSTEE